MNANLRCVNCNSCVAVYKHFIFVILGYECIINWPIVFNEIMITDKFYLVSIKLK